MTRKKTETVVSDEPGRLIGYARVSTVEQLLDLQTDALRAVGVDTRDTYTDRMSGGRADRPGLASALAACRTGDTLVVWRLDRLGRSVRDLANIVRDLGDRGVGFRSLTESVDTATTAGRLLMHVLAAVAEAERSMASDRIRAGMAARRARGVVVGRPPALSRDQIELARQLYESGQSLRQIARTVRGRNGKHPAPSTVFAAVCPQSTFSRLI
ncbi:recombinase family protein [Acidisoma cladoniae]|uniref:recombinase family protein n=1 Tax=Acidisoma cladoniae TaxID=3040935 RepID=UPI00254B5863|nr:recombinase family protein [Acidisoma sp. PAMC 29798]